MIAHKPLDRGPEPFSTAIVIVSRMPVVRIKKPAKSIHNHWTIGSASDLRVARPMRFTAISELYRSQRRLHFLFAE